MGVAKIGLCGSAICLGGFFRCQPIFVSQSKTAELLAARKATRDFSALKTDAEILKDLPKSSLDGVRETVLPEKFSPTLRKKLGLSQSEQLDCVGVVKRLCGNHDQFTVTSLL